jgi:hypothetical protein
MVTITSLYINDFFYNKETNCFSTEISELPTVKVGKNTQIKLNNHKTGNFRLFKFKNADMDSSQEDVYGWRYESHDGIKLLIIND